MSTPFRRLPSAERWRKLVSCARQGLEENGYQVRIVPGMGRQNVWFVKKDGVEKHASVRTTQDRHIAFPPLEGGRWKTLDDVEQVVVASVDDRDRPRKAEVFIFPADDVRKRFNEAHAARIKAGRTMTPNFGMWVALDLRETGGVNDIASGIAENYQPISVIPLDNELPEPPERASSVLQTSGSARQNAGRPNVQQALLNARREIAAITGVPLEQIRLELRIGS